MPNETANLNYFTSVTEKQNTGALVDNVKIMIVEDEDIIAEDVAEILERYGYSVVGRASAGEEAVRLARIEHPDLVLMDINLEGQLDGITAAALIRDTMEVPVIFLTAYADDETLDRAKVTGPYGYVVKPFKEVELRTAIEIGLHKYKSESPESVQRGNSNSGFTSRVQLQDLTPNDRRIFEVLRRVAPFDALSENVLLGIVKGCEIENVKGNTMIAFEGDNRNRGFVVVEGRVALVKSSATGKELIVELLAPGDPFSFFTILDSQQHANTVKAQVDSAILWVPKSKIMLALDSCPEAARILIRDVFERLRKAHDFSRALAHDLVEVRVASALSVLVPRFCSPEESENGRSYVINMTRQELAEMIGSTSETVIRATKAMERDGLLDLRVSGTIRILDREGLERIAHNC